MRYLSTAVEFGRKVWLVVRKPATSYVCGQCEFKVIWWWQICTHCYRKGVIGRANLKDPRPGYRWRKIQGEWYEVCSVCSGNCGQCGTSIGMGIPASLDSIVKSGNWHLGKAVGMGYARVRQMLDGR